MEQNSKTVQIYKDYLERNERSEHTIRLYVTVLGELDNFAEKPFRRIECNT